MMMTAPTTEKRTIMASTVIEEMIQTMIVISPKMKKMIIMAAATANTIHFRIPTQRA